MELKLIDEITKDVIRFFDLDEADLFNMKVDNGIKYLETHFTHSPQLIEPLKKHPEFWIWWRDLWAQRDLKLIQMCEKKAYGFRYTFPVGKTIKLSGGDTYTPTDSAMVFREEVVKFYSSFHHPRNVKFYPNYILINKCIQREEYSEAAYPK